MDTVEITVTPQIVAGRYELIRQLGAGGMGTVYLVRHVNTDERLAMKVLRKDVSDQLEVVERFKREMKASAILRSDNVTRITDADTATELGGAMYLVMELLDGADVEKLLAENKPLDPASAIFILGQAARALDKAHALGIIHRDLKPENLFLHRSEEFGLVVKVLDFGIAMFKTRLESDELRLTQDNTLLGTPLYMAPEQVLGSREEIGPRTDVWAIGMLAYDMLVGDNYWKVPSLGMLLSRIALGHMPAPSDVIPSLSKTFDEWFFRSCSRELPVRFASVREQVEALASVLSVDPVWIDAVSPPPSLLARVNAVSPPEQQRTASRQAVLPRSAGATVLPASGVAAAAASPSADAAKPASRSASVNTESANTDPANPAKDKGTRRWLLVLLVFFSLVGVGLFAILTRPSGNGSATSNATETAPVQSHSRPVTTAPTETPHHKESVPEPSRSTETESPIRSSKKSQTKSKGRASAKSEGKTASVAKSAKGKAKIDYDPVAP